MPGAMKMLEGGRGCDGERLKLAVDGGCSHVHASTDTQTHTETHTHAHTRAHTHARAHTHTDKRTQIHTHTHARTQIIDRCPWGPIVQWRS